MTLLNDLRVDIGDEVASSGTVVTGGFIRNLSTYVSGPVLLTTDNDIAVINVAAPTAVTLPSSPVNGQVIVVKDGSGDAFNNNITVSPSVGTIDGFASFVLTQNYQAVSFVYNEDLGEWHIF